MSVILSVSAERVTAGVQVERLRAAGGVEEWRTRGEGPRPDATFDSDHSSCWVACWPRTGLTMVTVVTVVLQSHDRRAWGDSFVAFTTSTHARPQHATHTKAMEGDVGCQCWGGILKCDHGRGCDPFFRRGRRHMKNKFCMQCNGKRGELYLPISRVRGLPEALHDIVTNSSEGGVWSKAPTALGANVLFRVINNTAVSDTQRRHLPPPLY